MRAKRCHTSENEPLQDVKICKKIIYNNNLQKNIPKNIAQKNELKIFYKKLKPIAKLIHNDNFQTKK